MPEKTIHYRFHEIVVDDEVPELTINGTEVYIKEIGDKYWTPERPYEEFLSLEGMAQQLIDDGEIEVE